MTQIVFGYYQISLPYYITNYEMHRIRVESRRRFTYLGEGMGGCFDVGLHDMGIVFRCQIFLCLCLGV